MLPIPFLGTSRVWYGVISADILIIISRLEEWNMQNKVWEQVGYFLNKLRCENVTRDTAVEVPGYRDTQQELEEMRETCEEIVRSLPEDQWQTLLEWMAKLEDMNSMEGQKAYCQGYVDCILLLSGLGLFRQEISPEELMKQIQ